MALFGKQRSKLSEWLLIFHQQNVNLRRDGKPWLGCQKSPRRQRKFDFISVTLLIRNSITCFDSSTWVGFCSRGWKVFPAFFLRRTQNLREMCDEKLKFEMIFKECRTCENFSLSIQIFCHCWNTKTKVSLVRLIDKMSWRYKIHVNLLCRISRQL